MVTDCETNYDREADTSRDVTELKLHVRLCTVMSGPHHPEDVTGAETGRPVKAFLLPRKNGVDGIDVWKPKLDYGKAKQVQALHPAGKGNAQAQYKHEAVAEEYNKKADADDREAYIITRIYFPRGYDATNIFYNPGCEGTLNLVQKKLPLNYQKVHNEVTHQSKLGYCKWELTFKRFEKPRPQAAKDEKKAADDDFYG